MTAGGATFPEHTALPDHAALLYDDPAHFTAAVTAFARGGLAEGDRVLVVAVPEKLDLVRDALGTDAEADGVDLRETEHVYRRQGQILGILLEHVAAAAGGGRRVRIVAEQPLGALSAAERAFYLRLEAAANHLYRDLPVAVLCPYEVSGLPPAVLDACRRTHPVLEDGSGPRRNPEFVRPRDFVAAAPVALPPPGVPTARCDRPEELAAIRAFVRDHAVDAGLDGLDAAELVLGADELLSNALVHGASPRRLWIYAEGGNLVCHVHDGGSGFADPLVAYLPSSGRTDGGRGLWIAQQTADALEVASDQTGTHVRLLVALGRGSRRGLRLAGD